MKAATAVAALLAMLGVASRAQAYHFHDARTDVIILWGNNLPVNFGPNDLHPPQAIQCTSTGGCAISIATSIAITSTARPPLEVCTLVDGVRAKPQCIPLIEFNFTTQQIMKVARGKHMVRTQIIIEGAAGTVGAWQVNYTTYENPPV